MSVLLLACSSGADQPKEDSSSPSSDTRAADADAEQQWAYSVGIQNYVFGLPLTIYERERALRMDPAALEKAKAYAPAAPLNQIGHMKTLATADDTMPYTPNNDTVYSGALLELRDEPMILTAPDTWTATGRSRSPTPTPTTSSTSAPEQPAARAATTRSWGRTGAANCRRE
ncbi:DUF1254 domain-containing protein [Nocardia sp. NPDC057668]|uniref:DUF1254 domain-containing protein n=1 Tax=Nocardia sp. NPDC057668 TaxID=3346202 RepID=UPI00366DBFCD